MDGLAKNPLTTKLFVGTGAKSRGEIDRMGIHMLRTICTYHEGGTGIVLT